MGKSNIISSPVIFIFNFFTFDISLKLGQVMYKYHLIIIFNIFRLWDNQYFHIQIFYIWYFLKAQVGDVCRVLMKIFVKWETNSRDFQIISEKFPGKRERILCAEIWHLVCTEAWEPPCLRSFLHTSSGDESVTRAGQTPGHSKKIVFSFFAPKSFRTRFDPNTETP